MSVLTKIKELATALLSSKVKDEFKVEVIGSAEMDAWVTECIHVYMGNPCWINEADHVDSVNFAKAICSETARLTTLAIGITVDGSPKAKWLQEQIDSIYFQLRHWVEYGCAYGTIILKPNGESIDLYTSDQFMATHITNGKIDGVIFPSYEQMDNKWFTRLEYHRFDKGLYLITNKCYVGNSPGDTKESVDIELTPWAGLMEEAAIEKMTAPLFAVFRTPHANNIDLNSPLGLPVFSEAIQELRDLDIAYSRNSKEILDSKRTVLADDSMIAFSGEKVPQGALAAQKKAAAMNLPEMVRMVRGDGRETYYQEINPELNTDTRLKGINALLSQIGYKVGYSNGYFVFNEKNGIQTATGVEAEQQRTIQFIKDVRDKLESCMNELIYALSTFADLYRLAPAGTYEVTYDFADITYSFEEDRQHHYQLAMQGHYPWEEYYVRFLRYSREEAQALLKQAKAENKSPTLFGGEE